MEACQIEANSMVPKQIRISPQDCLEVLGI